MTTVATVIYDQGAIIAADMQVTEPQFLNKIKIDMEKIFSIDNYCFVGIAGIPAVSEIVHDAKLVLDFWRRAYGDVSVDGKFNHFCHALKNIQTSLILMASFDKNKQKGRIFHISSLFSLEFSKTGFCAIGSGAPPALISLEKDRYTFHDSYRDAVRKVLDALQCSHEGNLGVGPKFIGYKIENSGATKIDFENLGG